MSTGYRKAYIYNRDLFAGTLEETSSGYVFQYDRAYLEAEHTVAISLTLPKQSEPYVSRMIFPFFDGLIPEGWVLTNVSRKWEVELSDRFGLLLVACKDCIGSVRIRSEKK